MKYYKLKQSDTNNLDALYSDKEESTAVLTSFLLITIST